MNRIARILAVAAIAITALAGSVSAGNVRKYTGNTRTDMMGKTEYKENLILVTDGTTTVRDCHLDGYSAMSYNNVSISAKLTTDASGKIISSENISIKGVPAKIKEITGTLSDTAADITLTGKAAGVFNFKVVYKGKNI